MLLLVLNLGEIVGSTYNPPPMTHPYHDHVTLLPVCMYVLSSKTGDSVMGWDGTLYSNFNFHSNDNESDDTK